MQVWVNNPSPQSLPQGAHETKHAELSEPLGDVLVSESIKHPEKSQLHLGSTAAVPFPPHSSNPAGNPESSAVLLFFMWRCAVSSWEGIINKLWFPVMEQNICLYIWLNEAQSDTCSDGKYYYVIIKLIKSSFIFLFCSYHRPDRTDSVLCVIRFV